MRLVSLTSNKSSFKNIYFNEKGLSIILGEKSSFENGDDKNKHTFNGVGKSLSIELVHFCLGADPSSDFLEKLKGWEFYLEFKIDNKLYKTSRKVDFPSSISLNSKVIEVEDFNKIMGNLCFTFPENFGYLSFRSLIPLFIRRNKAAYHSYNDYLNLGKIATYQTLLYNSFLLGLNIQLVKDKKELRDAESKTRKLEKQIKKDPVLKSFFTGNKDISLEKKNLSVKIDKLEKQLKNTQVAENYYGIKSEADELKKRLDEICNIITRYKYQISNIDESLQYRPDISYENLCKLYTEVKASFNDNVAKTLQDLENFNVSLLKNRENKLKSDKLKINDLLNNTLKYQKELEEELDKKLKFLNTHNAIDVFLSISDELNDFRNELNNYKKYEDLLKYYKKQINEIKSKYIQENEKTDVYLETLDETEFGQIDKFFREMATNLYPNNVSGITVVNNESENTIRYNIDAKIESDSSDGIGDAKIFCYDTSILFKGCNHKVDFLFHDNRIFSDIDPRQTTDILKAMYFLTNKEDKQYIISLNRNQIDSIRNLVKEDPNLITEDEYNSIIEENICLVLKDASDEDKLLGMKLDLKY